MDNHGSNLSGLGDFTTGNRVITISVIAVGIGVVSAYVALALLKLNAVVGVQGRLNGDGNLKTMGISCAICHSTVDDAFMPGIGHRPGSRVSVASG